MPLSAYSRRAAEKVQACLDGSIWLLSTSIKNSAKIVRTAEGLLDVYKRKRPFCGFARYFMKKIA